ncbi:MAG: hypothetical protein Q4C89_08265 [Deinococcus sp.]|uniref:hypothetical protein n=1 Tax=Deinococcus sp. TaxID=47478 RepID=UPI0026DD0D77|nr:hypothetical protein [Deinococcus sp.]MDO4246001.1 hypothetical protein [Deinococcus sp.]
MKPPRRAPLLPAFRWPAAGRLALAWPGLAALLSFLAVWLGAPTPAPEVPPRLTAGSLTPPLPELRPAPQPAPSVPLPAAPPPEPLWLARARPLTLWQAAQWQAPCWRPLLAMLGRWQLEG